MRHGMSQVLKGVQPVDYPRFLNISRGKGTVPVGTISLLQSQNRSLPLLLTCSLLKELANDSF